MLNWSVYAKTDLKMHFSCSNLEYVMTIILMNYYIGKHTNKVNTSDVSLIWNFNWFISVYKALPNGTCLQFNWPEKKIRHEKKIINKYASKYIELFIHFSIY